MRCRDVEKFRVIVRWVRKGHEPVRPKLAVLTMSSKLPLP